MTALEKPPSSSGRVGAGKVDPRKLRFSKGSVPLERRAFRATCRDIPERQRAKPSQFRRLI
jgi:hypothetical protein